MCTLYTHRWLHMGVWCIEGHYTHTGGCTCLQLQYADTQVEVRCVDTHTTSITTACRHLPDSS